MSDALPTRALGFCNLGLFGFTMTKTEKLLRALRTGVELTAKQISAKYGFSQPYSAIFYLRQQGIAVYGNPRKLSNGKVVTKYRIGTPTATMRAMGYTS
jgi:hypothetical protein